MIRSSLILIFCAGFLLNFHELIAQSPQMKLANHEYDFGKVTNVQYPPAAFKFENSGHAPLAILMVQAAPGVKINFPRSFIHPGQYGYIYVYPEGNNLGPFREEVRIYTNASDSALSIFVKGERISILSCFPNASDLTIRTVHVLNRITREPVQGASLHFLHNNRDEMNARTGRKGSANVSLKIGLYYAQISREGFSMLSDTFFLAKSVPELFFEIEPLTEKTTAPPNEFAENLPTAPSDTSLLPLQLYASNNIVFLIDVSQSMSREGKIETLKKSISSLFAALRNVDKVSLITYASEPKVVMLSVNGMQKEMLEKQVEKLIPQGTTNGLRGLESAFVVARNNFIPGGNNEVIIATDGLFSENRNAEQQLLKLIHDNAGKGIRLSVAGFGISQSASGRMQKMANAGNGSYIPVNGTETGNGFLLDEIRNQSRITK